MGVRNRKILAMWRAQISTSETLAAAKTSALTKGLREVTLYPEDSTDNIRMNLGAAATAATPALPVNGISFSASIDSGSSDTDVADLQVFAASASWLTVVEWG